MKMSEPDGFNALPASLGKKSYLVTEGTELALPRGLTQFHSLYKRWFCLCPVRAIKAQSFASITFIKASLTTEEIVTHCLQSLDNLH